MAHFYGTLKGARGLATRLGHKATGIETWTASWKGSVRVSLYYNDAHESKDYGKDMALVELRPWRGIGSDVVLYHGPVDGYDLADQKAQAARAKVAEQETRFCDECQEDTILIDGKCQGKEQK